MARSEGWATVHRAIGEPAIMEVNALSDLHFCRIPSLFSRPVSDRGAGLKLMARVSSCTRLTSRRPTQAMVSSARSVPVARMLAIVANGDDAGHRPPCVAGAVDG